MTRLQVGRSRVRIPAKEKHLSPSKTSRPALGATQPPLLRVPVCLLGDETAGA